MFTVGEINAMAVDAVQAAIPDAVHSASLSEDTQGAYDNATGAYAITTVTAAGRAIVETAKPIADIFPAYVVGPSDELVWLEGFTAARENMRLTFGGWVRHVTQSQDVLGAGSAFYVVARKVTLGPNESPTLGPEFDGNDW
jgi:hypothetical protein